MITYTCRYSSGHLIPNSSLQAPLLALHLPKSHAEAITRVLQITYAVREKGMEYKREQR